MRPFHTLFLIPLLAACQPVGPADTPVMTAPDAAREGDQLRPQARDDGDEAAAPAQGNLGTTIASLGSATEPGLWMKTPLVRREGPGQVRAVDGGASVSLRLIPTGGAPGSGSQLSLQAMQELGLSLTALPEVEVIAGG